ncbi:phthiocerol/phthiodiolone dimycocerosyltransferase, partial [Striga asiatica]
QREKMGAAQAMKRIPRIKFPQRHLKSSGATRQVDEISANNDIHKNEDLVKKFFSRAPSSLSVGGKASDQPKRTPVSQEEIEAIMGQNDLGFTSRRIFSLLYIDLSSSLIVAEDGIFFMSYVGMGMRIVGWLYLTPLEP